MSRVCSQTPSTGTLPPWVFFQLSDFGCNIFVIQKRIVRLHIHEYKALETKLQKTLTTAHHDHAKDLNAYAFYKVHNHMLGEDLVQDTFMKTWLYLVKNGQINLMRAFLYHVLNNLIIDQYRKRTTTSLDVLLERGFEPRVDESVNLFNMLDGKSALLLIERLPKKYRQVLHMRYIQELSLKEISLITTQSSNTVAVQIHRGIKKLKDLYVKHSS